MSHIGYGSQILLMSSGFQQRVCLSMAADFVSDCEQAM